MSPGSAGIPISTLAAPPSTYRLLVLRSVRSRSMEAAPRPRSIATSGTRERDSRQSASRKHSASLPGSISETGTNCSGSGRIGRTDGYAALTARMA